MKVNIYALFFFLWGAVLLGSACSEAPKQTAASTSEKLSKQQRIRDALDFDFELTKDPALGYPPTEELIKAIKQTRARQKELLQQGLDKTDITNPRFLERGPNNIGGRTRVIHIDLRDPERKTVWAGGVTGGLWKTENINAAPVIWEKVDDYLDNLTVGALEQDPNDLDVFYMGTGEGVTGFRGFGIYKSTDGGESFQALPSTQVGNDFHYTQNIEVHPQTGDIFAATGFGVKRSQDGGNTWQTVLGSPGDFFYDLFLNANNELIASNRVAVFRSSTGDSGSWQNLTVGKIPGMNRVEVAACPQDPDIMYLIGSQGGGASNVYRTEDGGQTWQSKQQPTFPNGLEFTRGQVWYDLDIQVDPYDCEHILMGGVIIVESYTGGTFMEFYQGNNSIHVDHHLFVFDEEQEGRILFGNDGGVYSSAFSADGSGLDFFDRNASYNVTQFYACAIHPEAFRDYFLGGTQDNNSLQLQGWGAVPARVVNGGDGAFAFVDQNEPDIQIVSSQNANYRASLDGGQTWPLFQDLNGGFINRSDYDDESNNLYAQTWDGDFYRWNLDDLSTDLVDITGVNFDGITAVTVDPNVPNRVYFGTSSPTGVLRVDNAHDGLEVEGEFIGFFTGNINCIDVQKGDPDHILVTLSNYGLFNNIHETKDGGDTWIGVEGTAISNNLPNIPVRWGIFNPKDSSQAMIATELGVWTTEKLDGENTLWIPPIPGRGTPLVRTDMLQVRESDKIVLAATHGRGLWTTDVFTDPTARMAFNQVHYLNSPLAFDGRISYNADEYLWEFGDGFSATEEQFSRTFDEILDTDVTLTINGNESTNENLKILPDMPLPYTAEAGNYGGGFEGETQQYGVWTLSGSSFERGNSQVLGKDGTNSGSNAFVVGLNEGLIEPNTETMLYLPKFDMSQQGIYEFSFYGKWKLNSGDGGMQVEYSKDGGQTWKVLNDPESDAWYNFDNEGVFGAAYPIGTNFFSRIIPAFKKYSANISGLSGEGDVAFRFVFKANNSTGITGLAIDDVVITRYDGILETQVTTFTAEFTGSTEMTINWRTLPEFNCKEFILEESTDGVNFTELDDFNATGGTTADPQQYQEQYLRQADLYFYRLKVINENAATGYSYEFYTPTVVARRGFIEGTDVIKVFPNPFFDQINLTFNNVIEGEVQYELFDAAARLVFQGSQILEQAPALTVENLPVLAPGVYFLRLRIGEGEFQTVRLLGGMR